MPRLEKSQLIYGVHPVLERLEAHHGEVREVLVGDRVREQTWARIAEAARRHGCPVRRVGTATLDGLTGDVSHQGVVARVAPFNYASMPTLLANLESRDACCVVFLDGVTDPRNFGSIVRTAGAMGIGDIVIPKDRSAPVTATVIKASAGAAQHVRIYRVPNLSRSLAAVRGCGLWIVGLDPNAGRPVYEAELPAKVAVVLGAEGAGIRPLVRRHCDYLLSVPMRGRVTSVNVSVAWGMFAYEWTRQKAKREGTVSGIDC